MKALKKFLIFLLLAVIVVFTLTAVLFSSPALQTQLLKHFLPEQLSLERAHLGLRGLAIDGLRYDDEALEIEVARLNSSFPLLSAIFDRHLHITELETQGVNVVMKSSAAQVDSEDSPPSAPRAKGADATDSPRPEPERGVIPWDALADFEGLLPDDFRWPPVSIDKLSVEGKFVGEEHQLAAAFLIDGADLAAGRTAQISAQIDCEIEDESLALNSLELRSRIALAISAPGLIDSIAIESSLAPGLRAPDAAVGIAEITLELALARSETGESYQLDLSIPQEQGAPIGIAQFELAVKGRGELAGSWKVDFRSEQLAGLEAELLHGTRGAASGSGSIAIAAVDKRAEVDGRLVIAADSLDKLRAELAEVGELDGEVDFDLEVAGEVLKVESWQARLDARADTRLLEMRSEQPFSYDLASGLPGFGDPERPLLRLIVHGLPVELVDALVPHLEIELESISTELSVAAAADGISLAATKPLRISGLSLAQAGATLAERIDISALPEASYRKGELSFQIPDLQVGQAGQEFMTATARGTVRNPAATPEFDVALSCSLEMAGLLTQPLPARFINLERGRIEADIDLKGSPSHINITGEMQADDIQVSGQPETIKSIRIAPQLAITDMSKIMLAGPVAIDSAAGRSDFHIDVGAELGGTPLRANIEIKGRSLVIAQFEALSKAYEPPVNEAAAPEAEEIAIDTAAQSETVGTAATAPPAKPVWDGFLGRASLELEEIVPPLKLAVRDLALALELKEDSILLESLRAMLDDSPVRATGGLYFDADNPRGHYRLAADLAVEDFDLGRFLRAADPGREPALEAVLAIDARVEAQAAALEELSAALSGSAKISARDGIFRGLRRGKVGEALEFAGLIGELAGQISGKQETEAVGRLVGYFNAVSFTSFEMEAERRVDGSIDVRDFALRNDDLLLEGTGLIGGEPGLEIHEQPLELRLELGVRPPLLKLFDRLELLAQPGPDQAGWGPDEYRPLEDPIVMKGQLNRPDSKDFWLRIAEAGARRLLDSDADKKESEADKIIRDVRSIFGF